MSTIRLRRGTTSQWATANPILAAGEPGVDTTLGLLKIGDGTHHWADLATASDEDAIPLTQKGAASGVASLNASGHVPWAQIHAGAPIVVRKDPATGFWPTSYSSAEVPVYTGGSSSTGVRPTARDDVCVIWVGTAPFPPSVTSPSVAGVRDTDVKMEVAV